jgi:hypothetical protein
MPELDLLTVEQLRRRAAYAGIRSIGGRSLKFARRADLLASLTAVMAHHLGT